MTLLPMKPYLTVSDAKSKLLTDDVEFVCWSNIDKRKRKTTKDSRYAFCCLKQLDHLSGTTSDCDPSWVPDADVEKYTHNLIH